MTPLVGYLLLFIVVGIGFVLVNLLVGKIVRPARPNAEKMTIYECGEPTIGSAWVQFDLRYYVVALLFVIFDVEVAFFFPWAVVFGQANTVANDKLPVAERVDAYLALSPPGRSSNPDIQRLQQEIQGRQTQIADLTNKGYAENREAIEGLQAEVAERQAGIRRVVETTELPAAEGAARSLGWVALGDILVFFGVLLVGFAYLWKRGDLAWVRSTAAEKAGPPSELPAPTPVPVRESGVLVGAGHE
jgi:NADH-quinone oxidoreductase subunit A